MKIVNCNNKSRFTVFYKKMRCASLSTYRTNIRLSYIWIKNINYLVRVQLSSQVLIDFHVVVVFDSNGTVFNSSYLFQNIYRNVWQTVIVPENIKQWSFVNSGFLIYVIRKHVCYQIFHRNNGKQQYLIDKL